MLRLIGSAVLGYIAIAATVFGGLSAAFVVLGPDRAFQPGAFTVSALWIITIFAIGLTASVLGGWVSRAIARTATGPYALAVLVLVLGVAMAVASTFVAPPDTGLRAAGMSPFEAMQSARTPLWAQLVNPIIGAIAVLIGGDALRPRKNVGPHDASGTRESDNAAG